VKGQLALPFEPYRIARGGRGRDDCDWLIYDTEGNEVQLAGVLMEGSWCLVWADAESLGMIREYAQVQAEALNRLAARGVLPHPTLGTRSGRQAFRKAQRAAARERIAEGEK
jgi:hypothetical protein